VAQMMQLTLPFIRYSNKVYINRVYDSVTLNCLQTALQEKSLNKLVPLPLEQQKMNSKELQVEAIQNRDPKFLITTNENKIPILILSPRTLKMTQPPQPNLPLNLSASFQKSADGSSLSEMFSELGDSLKSQLLRKTKNQGNLSLKEIWNESLQHPLSNFTFLEETSPDVSNSSGPVFDGIIVHIHGGGFVSMSSSSHQNYTRQ